VTASGAGPDQPIDAAVRRWSASAHDWSATWDAATTPVYAAIATSIRLISSTRLLDVGCGVGGLLDVARQHRVAAAGIDPAPRMIALARERLPDCDIRLGGLPDLPWPDNSFDVVVAVNSLLFAPDLRAGFDAMIRACRTGGARRRRTLGRRHRQRHRPSRTRCR